MEYARTLRDGALRRSGGALSNVARGHLLLGLCGLALSACVFEPPSAGPPLGFPRPNVPLSPLVDSSSFQVFDDPGSLVAFHGSGCAESDEPDRQKILRVTQSLQIPPAMDSAAIILRGWQFWYLEGDHELAGLGTAIGGIRRAVLDDGSHALEWDAYGQMSDNNFDDPYRWCYRFTVVAWSTDAYAAYVDQRDEHAFGGHAEREATALSFSPAFVEVDSRGGSPSAVVLPRGFGFVWDDYDDHNLLQLAYGLDPGASFIANGKQYALPSPDLGGTDHAGRAYYSWETKTVFKDNALQRDYLSGEVVSIASGPSVEATHPPFTIAPLEDSDADDCIISGKSGSASRSIGSIPYDVAIPVLTGWELAYVCDDQHVQEIGVWIDDFTYDPGAPGPRYDGRLDYTVKAVLRDRQQTHDLEHFRHRVSVLGFRKQPPPVPSPSLSVLPNVLRFPYPDHLGRPATTLNAFLTNYGNAAADRTAVAVVGPDATLFQLVSQHPPTRTLAPGEDERFTLRLAVACGAPTSTVSSSATLRIDTTEGRFEVPLSGQPYPCVAD